MNTIKVLRQHDLEKKMDPMGEGLLNRSLSPIRIWIPASTCIVLGNSQLPENELLLEAVAKDKIPVYKRSGGGGAVVLSPRVICLGIRLRRKSTDLDIHSFFNLIHRSLIDAIFQILNIKLEPAGISDLAFKEKKILGCSLYLPKNCALYLGSILVKNQVMLMEKYLTFPSREPGYRNKRNHSEFVTDLETITAKGIQSDELINPLQIHLSAQINTFLDWPEKK